MDATPAKPTYRRLPGRSPFIHFARSGASASTLWLGSDHLLKVDVRSSRETYKRFYYRDIQAILLEQSSRAFHITIFTLLTIAIIFLITLAFSRTLLSGLPVALILSAPFIFGLAFNLALRETSRAVLVTAVGTETLTSLSRMGRASVALQQISAEVSKVQGDLPTANLVALWPVAAAPPTAP